MRQKVRWGSGRIPQKGWTKKWCKMQCGVRASPECKSPCPCGRNGTEVPRLGKILRSPTLERNALTIVGLHPKIRTLSFSVSHTHLAALFWGPRLAIERRHHAPYQRRSARNTEKHSQGFQRRCCREDWFDSFISHHRTHQARTVTWRFSGSFVGIVPLEANWVASSSRPCLRFGGVLVHLHVPQILYFLLSRAVVTSRGSNGPPLTSSSAHHSAGGSSSASTTGVSSFGKSGRCCGGSDVPAAHRSDCYCWDIALMIVWHTMDE